MGYLNFMGVNLNLLYNLEAFFENGGANGLGFRNLYSSPLTYNR